MSDLLTPVLETIRLNSMIASLSLGDMKNEDAVQRMRSGDGSSVSYIVGHLLSSRYGMLKMLGAATDNPYAETFGQGVGSKDGSEYPNAQQLKRQWDLCAVRLEKALGTVSDEQALAPSLEKYPTHDATVRGALAFLAWHESYHIGQVGLLRTELGYSSTQQLVEEQLIEAP